MSAKIAHIATVSLVDAPDETFKASRFETVDGTSTFKTSAGEPVASFRKDHITQVVFGHPDAPEDQQWVLTNTNSIIDQARREAAKQ